MRAHLDAGTSSDANVNYMRLALQLARRGRGCTSPNPMVGAVLVKGGKIIGRGWHRRAGEPHAEIEAISDARRLGFNPAEASLYVTLEPCSTYGRTPPCTEAILAAGIRRVIVGASDPNPRHCGKGLELLRLAGIKVVDGVLGKECSSLNQAFNHWIVHRTPFVTVKAAMTLDGKIATASGESKWITSEKARAYGMKLRQSSDAILVGINTVLADDPSLTFRVPFGAFNAKKVLRRVILDAYARTPLGSKVASDAQAQLTTVFVSKLAPPNRVASLSKVTRVVVAPLSKGGPPRNRASSGALDLTWILKHLGAENITSLLVEGGGEVNASFLFSGLVQQVTFFYAPKILGGRASRRAVAGAGAARLREVLTLQEVHWRKLGPDWLLTASLPRR